MGGKGGLKKQKAPKVGSKKRPALVAAEEPAEEPQAKRAASAPSTGDSLPAFEPLGATHTDYSEGEGEGEEPAPMQLLDESTTQAVKREVRKTQRPSGGVRPTPPGAGVLYLGHVPHGFYEEQMRGFFSQFGAVTRLRLARNKKTGRSKHYAFVEFKHRDVCEIVAKAMNGYLIYSKVLVAKVMEPQQVHPEMFKGAERPFKVVDRVAVVRKQHNRERSAEETTKRAGRLVQAERKRRKQLEALGIDYAFNGYEAAASARAAGKPRAQLSDGSSKVASEAAAPAAAAAQKRKEPPAAAPAVEEVAEAAEAPRKKAKKAAAAPKAAEEEAAPKKKVGKAAAPEEAPAPAVPEAKKKKKKQAGGAEPEPVVAAEPAPKKAKKAKRAA